MARTPSRLPSWLPFEAQLMHSSEIGELRGLIIDEPFISEILNGSKTWEMRSRHTDRRGLIALIAKGSGAVVGAATLIVEFIGISLS